MSIFYDTHAHLDYPQFSNDLRAAIERAQAAGITRLITVGTDFDSSRRAIALSECIENVFAVVGWHPTHALEAPEDLRPALRDLARHPKVVAIGETGLDYYRMPSHQEGNAAEIDAQYKRKQAEIFRQQLEVAAELGLNCVIHERSAFADVLATVRPFAKRLRGQFHCFAGNADAMRQVLEIGSLVSFTGMLTFKNGQNIRDTLASTPLHHFMLETDCPFLAPEPFRKQRCEPAHVAEIAKVAAQVKDCTLEELSAATCDAVHQFFPKLK